MFIFGTTRYLTLFDRSRTYKLLAIQNLKYLLHGRVKGHRDCWRDYVIFCFCLVLFFIVHSGPNTIFFKYCLFTGLLLDVTQSYSFVNYVSAGCIFVGSGIIYGYHVFTHLGVTKNLQQEWMFYFSHTLALVTEWPKCDNDFSVPHFVTSFD